MIQRSVGVTMVCCLQLCAGELYCAGQGLGRFACWLGCIMLGEAIAEAL